MANDVEVRLEDNFVHSLFEKTMVSFGNVVYVSDYAQQVLLRQAGQGYDDVCVQRMDRRQAPRQIQR